MLATNNNPKQREQAYHTGWFECDADAVIIPGLVCTGDNEDFISTTPVRACIETSPRRLEFAIGDAEAVGYGSVRYQRSWTAVD